MGLLSFFRRKGADKNKSAEAIVNTTSPAEQNYSENKSAEAAANTTSPAEQNYTENKSTEAAMNDSSQAEQNETCMPDEKSPNSTSNPPKVQPIYAVITSHLQDGVLPDGFSLGERYNTGFVPGAKDGIGLYHMHPVQPDPERSKKILEVLTLISEEEGTEHVDRIMNIFEELDRQDSIARLFDEINHTIYINHAKLDLQSILGFGDYLICYGVSFLAVKAGLTLLGGFKVPFVEDVCLELGAYEEFTYFAARILSNGNWEKGNEDLFKLAKQLRGWGRIFAVDYLRPETQEIKDWLLFEGSENDIVPQYSADVCLQKAGALERLILFSF